MAAPFPALSAPLVQAPLFARDPHELRSVVAAQTAEVDALKEELAHAQRQCARLRQRLRDSESDLLVAAEATSSATDRLGAHAIRHGLVLASSVERSAVERSALENELQRMERLLCERDHEIAQLRRAARELESSQLQGDLELRGLASTHEMSSSEAQALGVGVSELLHRIGGASGPGSAPTPAWPSQREVAQTREITQSLATKREEHQALKSRVEAVAAEARRLEVEEGELAQVVGRFDQGLRAKHQQLQTHDQKFIRDESLLREHCDELRQLLHHEKLDAVCLDQRAVLQPQSGIEAEGVRKEVNAILQMMPGLAAQLRARGRSVCSAKVIGDVVDERIHAYLKDCVVMDDPVPSLVCRLDLQDYFIGGERVAVFISREGQLVVQGTVGGQTVALHDFVNYQRAQLPTAGGNRSPLRGQRSGSPPRSGARSGSPPRSF